MKKAGSRKQEAGGRKQKAEGGLKELFLQELFQLASDAQSARFLLAVSGGCDSVALARLFAQCNFLFDIAHCNFHLRGEESNKEMAFVKKLPFLTIQKVFVQEFDTISIQHNSGKSIEMVARELRYRWFEEIGKEYDYIVTAHHANDNAETVLLNLLRGSGLRGICGIPQKNGKIIRPLLKFRRREIENYCLEQGLEFCEDSSNVNDRFLRNQVRRYVIPELEKISPNVIDTFSKNSALCLQQAQFYNAHIQQDKNRIVKETPERITIEIKALKNITFPSLVLYELLSAYGFNADDTENILQAASAASGKQFLSNTHILIKDRTHFIIEKREAVLEEELSINSVEDMEKLGFKVEKLPCISTFNIQKVPHVIYLDTEKLTFPLTLRSWKKGDAFYPFGMKTRKKLSNFFTDLKIDLLEKQKIRLLCAQEQIVWIIGYRADERFRVDENTKWFYKITANR